MRKTYNKKQAIDLFGSPTLMAKAMKVTPQRVYSLPDKLPRRKSDEILGFAIRTGRIKVVEVES